MTPISALLTSFIMSSIKTENKIGANTEPCVIPVRKLNESDKLSFHLTQEKLRCSQLSRMSIRNVGTLHFISFINNAPWCTLGNALAMSNAATKAVSPPPQHYNDE